jgi:hypothetical protein
MRLNGASVLGNETEILHGYPRFDWPHGPPLPDLPSLGLCETNAKFSLSHASLEQVRMSYCR